MLVDQQDTLDGPPHANLLELFPHALEPRRHRTVSFIQRLFRAERIVRERIQVDSSVQCEV